MKEGERRVRYKLQDREKKKFTDALEKEAERERERERQRRRTTTIGPHTNHFQVSLASASPTITTQKNNATVHVTLCATHTDKHCPTICETIRGISFCIVDVTFALSMNGLRE